MPDLYRNIHEMGRQILKLKLVGKLLHVPEKESIRLLRRYDTIKTCR